MSIVRNQAITEIIKHLSYNSKQLSRVLAAQKLQTERMSRLIHEIPDTEALGGGFPDQLKHSEAVTQGVTMYLNSLAELQGTLAAEMTLIMRELRTEDGEDEME